MLDLWYKLKIIFLLEKYGLWFYNKTDLYKEYFKKDKDGNLKLDYTKIVDISHPKEFYEKLKEELDYLAFK